MRALLLTLLLASGCHYDTIAFTLPLPHGFSTIIQFTHIDDCVRAHEKKHQEQVRRLGSQRFVGLIIYEYARYGDLCGPLEWEAYKAEWKCEGLMDDPRWDEQALREELCQ